MEDEPELLLLHALPLDGAMWTAQMDLLPGRTLAPTLYRFGADMGAWARGALGQVRGRRLVVVGCSVGGSCALEVAAVAPERVAALVLIGTKARHRPDPALRDRAVEMLRSRGLAEAWQTFWRPLFSPATPERNVAEAEAVALRQAPEEVVRGVGVFHSRPSRDDVLKGFPGRIDFVTGAEDVAPGPAATAAQAGQAQDGRLHVVPDCGHYVPSERPEALNAILREVIASVG